ncbi:MAG TPA: hypothetical protein VFW87_02940, partial [Pirellulales bacterium]|nr:hypothetical protein [Pirellulales bacterium]
DGNGLNFNFWVLSAAGTYEKAIEIANSGSGKATIQVPADSAGKTFHVICEATDDGMPKLSGYRRIIFKPTIDQPNIKGR